MLDFVWMVGDAIRQQRPSRRTAIAALLLAAVLVTLSGLAAVYERFPGDLELTRAIQGLDVPGLRRAMRLSTDITSPVYSLLTLIIVVSVLLAMGLPRFALISAGALIAHGLGGLIKLLVARERPDPDLVQTVRLEQDYSFPSGHVEWVVSFEGFLLFAVYELSASIPIRVVATGLWLTHLLLTSTGRIDQGLHWPSDILASYLVGALALLFLVWLYGAVGCVRALMRSEARPAFRSK